MYCGVPIAEPGRVKDESSRERLEEQSIDRLALGIGQRLGDPPIDDERLAEPAEHDVLGLQVAMDDAAAVRVGDRVAGVDDAAQQPAERDLALGGLARAHLSGPWNRSIACLRVSPSMNRIA